MSRPIFRHTISNEIMDCLNYLGTHNRPINNISVTMNKYERCIKMLNKIPFDDN